MEENSLKSFQDLLVWLELEQNIFEKNLRKKSETRKSQKLTLRRQSVY